MTTMTTRAQQLSEWWQMTVFRRYGDIELIGKHISPDCIVWIKVS